MWLNDDAEEIVFFKFFLQVEGDMYLEKLRAANPKMCLNDDAEEALLRYLLHTLLTLQLRTTFTTRECVSMMMRRRI
jgi:hypothetical protein